MGKEAFRYFYMNYMIFLRTIDDSLIQIAGRSLFVFLHPRFARNTDKNSRFKEDDNDDYDEQVLQSNCHKFNLKDATDSYLNNTVKFYWQTLVTRNRLFYSTHMNRNNTFFKRHILPVKKLEKEQLD